MRRRADRVAPGDKVDQLVRISDVDIGKLIDRLTPGRIQHVAQGRHVGCIELCSCRDNRVGANRGKPRELRIDLGRQRIRAVDGFAGAVDHQSGHRPIAHVVHPSCG